MLFESVLAIETETETVADLGGRVGNLVVFMFISASPVSSCLLGLPRHVIILIFL